MKAPHRFQILLVAMTSVVLTTTSLAVATRRDSTEPGSQATAPPNGSRAAQRFRYVCEGGAPVVVVLRGETARVSFKGKVFHMKQTASASGARYSDGSMVWWNKGRDGFLQMDNPSGDGEMVAKDCHDQTPPDPTNRP
jgi:membrane-bound inhibitor of C-type lysozyme